MGNNLDSPSSISVECQLESLTDWYEAEVALTTSEAVRSIMTIVGRHSQEFFRWPRRALLLWHGCDRVAPRNADGKKAVKYHRYPDVIKRMAKSASIELEFLQGGRAIEKNGFPRSGWDVVCGAAIAVNQGNPRHKRAASLWYTRRESRSGDYRWVEVGYESNPLTGRGFEFDPVALDVELADRAHSRAMDIVQTSYNAVPIDDEDADSFAQRWAYLLGEAVAGRLQHVPRGLPR